MSSSQTQAAAPAPRVRRTLNERNALLWRTIANAGQRGLTKAELLDRMRGHFDADTLHTGLVSLRACGYIEAQHNLWSSTRRLPLGEREPACWSLDDSVTDGAGGSQQGGAAPYEGPRGPRSVFDLAGGAASDAPAPVAESVAAAEPPAARTESASPRFAFTSDGCFHIDVAGRPPIELEPTATRAMFRYLDAIGGLRLSELVQEA